MRFLPVEIGAEECSGSTGSPPGLVRFAFLEVLHVKCCSVTKLRTELWKVRCLGAAIAANTLHRSVDSKVVCGFDSFTKEVMLLSSFKVRVPSGYGGIRFLLGDFTWKDHLFHKWRGFVLRAL